MLTTPRADLFKQMFPSIKPGWSGEDTFGCKNSRPGKLGIGFLLTSSAFAIHVMECTLAALEWRSGVPKQQET